MGPRPNPGGGSSQSTQEASQANWADARSGILSEACASAGVPIAKAATLVPTAATEAQRRSSLNASRWGLALLPNFDTRAPRPPARNLITARLSRQPDPHPH